LKEISVSLGTKLPSTVPILLLSTINGNLVGREELRSSRCTILLGEQGQQAVADLELFDHGAEAGKGEIRQ
jgi:hypothetical protein